MVSNLNKNIIDGPLGIYFKFSDDNFDKQDLLKFEVIDFIKSKEIEKIIILEKSDVSPIGVTIKTTDFLKQIDFIKEVSLINFQMKLDGIQFLKKLENLYIGSTNEPIDFTQNPCLKTLSFTYDKHRISVFDCVSIEDLIIWSYNLNDFQSLQKLINLKKLELITTSIKSFDGIENLEKLEKLEVTYARNLHDANALTSAKRLKWLRLQNYPKLEDLSDIDSLHQLEFLALENCKNIKDLENFFNLENLEVLAITNSGNFSSIKGIENLKSLKRLIIRDSKILDNDLSPILKLRNLEFLYFDNNKNYNFKLDSIKKQLSL